MKINNINLKKILLISVCTSTLILFSGCGSDSDTQMQGANTNKKVRFVYVIDGYIANSEVYDSNQNVAKYDIETKKYNFALGVEPVYPIIAKNGFFENTKIDDRDVENLMVLKSIDQSKIISPLSTFIANFPDKKKVLLGDDTDKLNIDYIKQSNKDLLILNQYLYTIQANGLSNELNETLNVQLAQKDQGATTLNIKDIKNATINAIYEASDMVINDGNKTLLRDYIYKVDEVANKNQEANLFEKELAKDKNKMQANSKEAQEKSKELANDPQSQGQINKVNEKQISVNFEPKKYSENNELNSSIVITFSNDLNLSALNAKDFNLSAKGGGEVAFDIDSNIEKTIVLKPKNNLSYDTTYILVLSKDVKKIANGKLSDRVLQFSTTTGTVVDTNTALIWEDKAEFNLKEFSFEEAQEHCAGLEKNGEFEWRLPTKDDFESLVDYDKDPVVSNIFKHVSNSKQYWSSTPYYNYAYGMSFKTGDISSLRKTEKGFAKCVSGKLREEAKPTCIAVNKNVFCGKLTWKDESQIRVKIDKAKEYCTSLGNGFRLPTYKELKSIYDNKKLVSGFKDALKGQARFWTSTKKGNEYAAFSFAYGDTKWNSKSWSNDVRCVSEEKFDNNPTANTQDTDIVTVKPVQSLMKKLKKLPQTGQMASYDEDEKEVSDSSLRDDYFYKDKGIKAQFTRDEPTSIVIDHVTGLQWQDDESANEPDNKFLRRDFSDEYCKSLKLDGGGWRLPDYVELQTIIDHGKHAPALNEVFQNVSHEKDFVYQSLTDTVEFYSGEQLEIGRSVPLRVRCVRGEKIKRAECVRDDNKQVATCEDTNLMWQDNQVVNTKQYFLPWKRAIQTCEDLTLAGYDDWRLPNINELNSIVYNKAIKNGYSEEYAWSSTTDAEKHNNVWTLRNGTHQDWNVKTYEHAFRCVRSIK